jgi:hypothetical protein
MDKVVSFLGRQKRVSSFKKGIRVLEANLARDEVFCFEKLLSYSSSPQWVARYLVARNLPRFISRDEEGVEKRLKELAEDENPLVREGLAWGLAQLLEHRFHETLLRYEHWGRDPSEAVRRAVMMATVPLIKGSNESLVEVLLDFLGRFLDDPSPAIRRELVRFVVGRILLELHPHRTLRWLHNWLSRGDPRIDRQLSYLLLASPLPDRYPREALQLTKELAAHPMFSPVIQRRIILILSKIVKSQNLIA